MDEYAFGPGNEYRVLVAADGAARERALSLVYGVYLAAGLTESRASRMLISAHDALPGTTCFLVERLDGGGAAAVASLTLIPDGVLGLPLDAVAGPALAELRAAGRRPVELAKLATVAATERKAGARRAPREEILLHLFKLAWLTAWRTDEATDLVIAVSPHQERYFRRIFLFEPLNGPGAVGEGEEQLAVPMRLDLTTAEERHRERYAHRLGERNLFRFFVNEQEPEVLAWLKASRGQLAAEDVRYLFADKTDLLGRADEATRRLILESYPGLEIADSQPSGPGCT